MSDSSESDGAEESAGDAMSIFISAYESLPCLWDPGHEHYLNKLERSNALRQLLDIYRKIRPAANAGDIKLKINSLRTTYRRELRKVATSRRLGCSERDCYKPTSRYFHALGFLRKLEEPLPAAEKPHKYFQGKSSLRPDVKRTAPVLENLSANHSKERPSKRTALKRAAPTEVTKATTPLHSSIPTSPETHEESERTSLHEYVRQTDLIERQNELLEHLGTHLERAQLSQEPPGSVIPTIAKAWGEQLLNLEPKQRFFAEKAINDILFEASLGNLNRYSVQINLNESPNGIVDQIYFDNEGEDENENEDDDDPIIHELMNA